MAKILNIKKEVQSLRKEVMQSFRTYLPAKEFSTRIILALVWMHMLVRRIEASRDLNERRKLLQDFDRSKRSIVHSLRDFRQYGNRRIIAEAPEAQCEVEASQANHNGRGAIQKTG